MRHEGSVLRHRAMSCVALLVALSACAEMVPSTGLSETVTVDGRPYPLRYTPTGDSVPNLALGAVIENPDGSITNGPVRPDETVAYPTVRIGNASDPFAALDVWYARCAPGDMYDRADFMDEVFVVDDRTGEYIFAYPCPPLGAMV